MTELLGLPLDEAVRRLEAAGETVTCVEVSSRKGSTGTDARVIQTERVAGKTVLRYARFQTEAKE